MPLPPGADEQPPRPTRHSQRARRAPAAPDKTPPPPAAPPPKAPRRRRQPAPPSQPSVDPDAEEERARVPKPALAIFSTPTSPMPLWAMVLVRQKILLGRIATMVSIFRNHRDHLPQALHRVLALVRVVDNATHRVLVLMPPRLLLVVAEQRVAPDGVKRECAFCKQHHSANPRDKEPKPFAPSTSTGILRRHLYERHLEVWVQGCDQLKIDITAREALPHVEAYRGKQNGSNSSSTADSAKKQPPFSNEAFVDAIVEWIVSDDQQSRVHVHIPVHEFPSDDQTYEYLHLRGSNLPAKNVEFGFLRFPLRLMLKTSEFLRFRGSSIQADVHDSRIPAYLPAFKLAFTISEFLHSCGSSTNADVHDSRIPASLPVQPFKTSEFLRCSFKLSFPIPRFLHSRGSSANADVHDARIPESSLPNSCVVVGPAFKLMFKTSELLRYRGSSVQAIVPNSPIPAFPWLQRQR
ncbi:hypothetical protein R3P38DRAFT_3522585 [Favolaschia claudopus]|uniref:Uncharacterized protein n=1 Tax=Favolaschia claudopus TaxID=2862362 RepID=A0AAW0E8B6_9AGAR